MDTFNARVQPVFMLVFFGLAFSVIVPLTANPVSKNLYWKTVNKIGDIVRNDLDKFDEPRSHYERAHTRYHAIKDIFKDTQDGSNQQETKEKNGYFLRGQMDMIKPDPLDTEIRDLDFGLVTDNTDNDKFNYRQSQNKEINVKRSGHIGFASSMMSKRLYDKRSFDMYTRYLNQLMKFLTIRNERRLSGKDTQKKRQTMVRRYDTLDILGSGLIGR